MCLPVKPFKVEREWEFAGLRCAVVLARESSHRCGYVRVPPTHPLHGKDCGEPHVDVHGGLTFGELEPCTEHPDGQGWWFGFDCAHLGDAIYDPDAQPENMTTEDGAFAAIYKHRYGLSSYTRPDHYWTQSEVEAETERLAEQLAA
jgi:hypothetical protein